MMRRSGPSTVAAGQYSMRCFIVDWLVLDERGSMMTISECPGSTRCCSDSVSVPSGLDTHVSMGVLRMTEG